MDILPDQLFYLERNGQFWEIKRASEKTTIRAGKIGKTGRNFGERSHESVSKAKQFMRQQVNAKIIQGFEDKTNRSDHISNKTETCSSLSTGTESSEKKQLKKLSLKKSDTIDVKNIDTKSNAWRKPPKKQSTVRRQAKLLSINLKAKGKQNSLSKQNTTLIKKVLTKRDKLNSPLTTKKCQTLYKQNTTKIEGQSSLPKLERRHTSWKYSLRYRGERSIPLLPLESVTVD